MCLTKVLRTSPVSQIGNKMQRGWKVFRITPRAKYLTGDCRTSCKFLVGWNKANTRKNLESGDAITYKGGFHVWTTKEAAREWACGLVWARGPEEVVVPVWYYPKRISTIGSQNCIHDPFRGSEREIVHVVEKLFIYKKDYQDALNK